MSIPAHQLLTKHICIFSFNLSHTSKCKSVQASVQWILIRYTKGKKFKRHTASLQQLLWRVIADLRRHVRACVCCYVELSSKAGKYLLASFFALLLLPLVLVKIRSRGSSTKNQTYCSGIPPLRPCLEARSEDQRTTKFNNQRQLSALQLVKKCLFFLNRARKLEFTQGEEEVKWAFNLWHLCAGKHPHCLCVDEQYSGCRWFK